MAVDAVRILERYQKLKAVRDGLWLNVWREVRRYVYPTYSDYLAEGGMRGGDVFDTTAQEARKRLAAGMYNWMAPPDRRWFELAPVDEGLGRDEDVKDYFAETTKAIAFALANSNWPTVLIQLLNNLACGLDAVCHCEDGGERSVLVFRSFPVESVCYCEDSEGLVDTVFRETTVTARQYVASFAQEGDQLPGKVREEAADAARMDAKHRLLHVVMPRRDRDPELYDNANMPFADLYIDMEAKSLVRESGHEENPYAVCRFEKSDNESYGRGPGLDMLPDIKMLNRMRQAYIVTSERHADPNWLVPDGSVVSRDFDRDPGGVIIYKPDMAGARPEPVTNGADLGRLYQDIEAERERIRTGFFWDIFDPLGDLRQITATEAEIRNEGKMIPFAPIAGSLHSELFKAVIHRAYGICERRGILPQRPPALLARPDYKVDFVSKIALSIKKLESLGWIQTQAAVGQIAAASPEVMDNFDLDEVARDIAQANGVSPKWMVPVRKRDETRQAREGAQQAQAGIGAMQDAAAALGGNLSKAPEKGSPLDMVMSGRGV